MENIQTAQTKEYTLKKWTFLFDIPFQSQQGVKKRKKKVMLFERHSGLIVFFFFVFEEKIKFLIFLSQWPLSLFVRKLVWPTVFSPKFFSPAADWLNLRKLVSVTVFFAKIFSPAAGWLLDELHLGVFFSLQKLSERHYLCLSDSFFSKKRIPKCNS